MNVPTAQYVTVELTGVTDLNGTIGNFSNTMGVLIGDTNADTFVDSADISQTKSESGISVGSSNFREDINLDGFIDSADIAFVKSKSGTTLPPPPPPGPPAASTSPTPINTAPSDTQSSPPKTKPRKSPRSSGQSR